MRKLWNWAKTFGDSDPAGFCLPETLFVCVFCLADLLFTDWAVASGVARETNPVLAFCFRHGIALFVAVKLTSFLLPVAFLEQTRSGYPTLIRSVIRVTLMAYALFYLVATLGVNRHLIGHFRHDRSVHGPALRSTAIGEGDHRTRLVWFSNEELSPFR